ncbi:hypothetical protein D9M68_936780 [compost metagenome]
MAAVIKAWTSSTVSAITGDLVANRVTSDRMNTILPVLKASASTGWRLVPEISMNPWTSTQTVMMAVDRYARAVPSRDATSSR